MEKDKDKVDFRYVTKDNARDFHKRRRAFVIYKGNVLFIKEGSPESHWEFCKKNIPDITKDEFNQIIRGYYLNGDIVFYKDNFTYDEEVIKGSIKYINLIKKECHVEKVKVYFGLIVGESDGIWPYTYYYNEL